MTRSLLALSGLLLTVPACFAGPAPDAEGFLALFNGKDLTGWKISENPDSFRVENGELIAVGERAHLFYVGEVNDADFQDFEVKLRVLTRPNANAGFYFHTKWQDTGWPSQGYEAQINAMHKDPKKTGSVYAVANVMDHAPHADDEWFDYHIIVRGKTITLKVNGEVTATFTEREGKLPNARMPGRVLSHGTFAIQCHDPGSEVRFRSIRVKPL